MVTASPATSSVRVRPETTSFDTVLDTTTAAPLLPTVVKPAMVTVSPTVYSGRPAPESLYELSTAAALMVAGRRVAGPPL